MTAKEDFVWAIESPTVMQEGEEVTFAGEWLGDNPPTSPSTTVFREGADITDSVVSGSDSVSGQIQTLKAITAQDGHAGSKYVVVAQATVAGNTEKRKIEIEIIDPAGEQS